MAAWQDIAQSQSARVQQLDAWWRAKAGDRTMPDRGDLDPSEIAVLLPYVLLAEVVPPFRVRYRLVGSEVATTAGLDFTGSFLDELIPPNDKSEPWMERYRQSFDTAAPVYGRANIAKLHGGVLTFEYGIWPLSKGSNGIRQFIAIEDYGNQKTRTRALREPLAQWRRA